MREIGIFIIISSKNITIYKYQKKYLSRTIILNKAILFDVTGLRITRIYIYFIMAMFKRH